MQRICFFAIIVNTFLGFMYSQELPYKALIVVSVADLVTEPLSLQHTDVEQAYRNIPISWGPQHADKSTCSRQHQALFNEQVTVIAVEGQEVCIEISNAFSELKNEFEPQIRYWTLQKNICPINKIPQAVQQYLPRPLDYRNKDMHQSNANVITLTWPLYETTTKLRYSAGTRFVYAGTVDDAYCTYIYNYAVHAMHKIMIPKRYARIGIPGTPQMCISHFVNLLRDWARSAGFIPLVWGGISFTKKTTMEGFTLQHTHNGQGQAYWQLHEDDGSVYTGFDASGLVLRAAQICGIPYFFKNTITAEQHIRYLAPGESLQEGDLLYVPGGLLIVSDLVRNKIISAFGYQFGFGKVVERSLADVFEGIMNYADLLHAYKNQHPLNLKNKQGNIATTVTSYAFLKLASLWEK